MHPSVWDVGDNKLIEGLGRATADLPCTELDPSMPIGSPQCLTFESHGKLLSPFRLSSSRPPAVSLTCELNEASSHFLPADGKVD